MVKTTINIGKVSITVYHDDDALPEDVDVRLTDGSEALKSTQIIEGYPAWIERSIEWWSKSLDEVITLGSVTFVKDMNKAVGDDWNDNPAEYNAGPPYEEYISDSLKLDRNKKYKIIVQEL